jgi:hypothetical protein
MLWGGIVGSGRWVVERFDTGIDRQETASTH